MNNIYLKKTDVIRSLFDYLEDKKTIGQCIDDTPAMDMDVIINLLEAGNNEQALKILKGE